MDLRDFFSFMEYNIQLFKNVCNNHVNESINLSQWVSMLKGSDYSKTIEDAREGLKDYDSTKISLPCVNYQFLFKQYKKNSNITDSTGLLYYDIDDPRFIPKDFDLSTVCLFHKSFGGVGSTIVVRVEGMDEINYRFYYEEIARDLGISDYVDYNAAKHVQTNVLSYDRDVYYNSNSKVYRKYPPMVSILNKKEGREKHIERGGGQKRKQGFCFSNLDLMDFEGKDYYVDWFNISSIRCHIPTIKKTLGSRNNMLLAFGANFMTLNPYTSKSNFIIMLESVNKKGCYPTLKKDRIEKIANSILKYKKEDKLKPIYAKKKRSIVFNKDSNFTTKEKQIICGEESKKYWKSKSCNKIQDIISSWDFEKLGKISGRKIYKNNPVSKKTVEKYYKFFKEDIKQKNEKFAENK